MSNNSITAILQDWYVIAYEERSCCTIYGRIYADKDGNVEDGTYTSTAFLPLIDYKQGDLVETMGGVYFLDNKAKDEARHSAE